MMLVLTYAEDYKTPLPMIGDRVFFTKDGTIRPWHTGDRDDGGVIKKVGVSGILVETRQFTDRHISDRQLAKKNQEISRLRCRLLQIIDERDIEIQHHVNKIAGLQKLVAEKDVEIAGLVRRTEKSNDTIVRRLKQIHDRKINSPITHDSSYLQRSIERIDADRAASARVRALLDPVHKASQRRRRRWWKPWTWRRQ